MQRIAIAGLFLSLMGCTAHRVQFLNEPCLKPYDKFDFRLCDNFIVQVDNTIYTVPSGFITDLASVPRIMWACYSPNDSRTIPAAILHDYMYRSDLVIPRKVADDIFYHALLQGGTRKRTASKYYIGVRVFGWMFYRK
jgi:hypothetical protein